MSINAVGRSSATNTQWTNRDRLKQLLALCLAGKRLSFSGGSNVIVIVKNPASWSNTQVTWEIAPRRLFLTTGNHLKQLGHLTLDAVYEKMSQYDVVGKLWYLAFPFSLSEQLLRNRFRHWRRTIFRWHCWNVWPFGYGRENCRRRGTDW